MLTETLVDGAYGLLFVALLLALGAGRAKVCAHLALAASLACAGYADLLHAAAIPALLTGAILLAAHCYVRQKTTAHPVWQTVLLIVIALWALAAALHLWPGFTPLRWMEHFGRHAQPLQWRYDKALGGVLLLLVLPRSPIDFRPVSAKLVGLISGVAGILALTLLLGLARYAPAWPAGIGLFLAGNLFLTVFAEEAFFRGFIQGGVQSWLSRHTKHAYIIALICSSLMFGLVHLPWGFAFAGMASLAGVFYGLMADSRGNLAYAITAHFLTNAAIIVLLDSPMG